MSRTKSTKWNLIFQLATVVLAFINGIAFVPLYLKYIPNVLYGLWLATGNILNWITIIDPGISTILQQRIAAAYGKKDNEGIGELISSGLILTVIISTAIIVVGGIFSCILPTLLNLGQNEPLIRNVFFFAVVGTSLTIFSYSLFQISLGMLGSIGCGSVNVASIILGIIVTVLALVNGAGIWSFAYAIMVRGVFAVVGHGILVQAVLKKHKIKLHYQREGVRSLFSLVMLTFTSRIAGVIAGNVDAFLVAGFVSADVVPIYELTRKAPETSRVIIERPSVSFLPALSHLLGEDNIDTAKKVVQRVMLFLLWSVMLIVGGLLTFDYAFVRLWVGGQYFAGHNTLFAICFSLFFTLISSILSNILFAIGEIRVSIRISIIQSIMSVILSTAGVYFIGFTGLALAPGVAALTTGFWLYPKSIFNKLRFTAIEVWKIVFEFCFAAVCSIILFIIYQKFSILNWRSFIVLTAAYFCSYGALLFIVSRSFRTEVASFANNIKGRIFSNP